MEHKVALTNRSPDLEIETYDDGKECESDVNRLFVSLSLTKIPRSDLFLSRQKNTRWACLYIAR